MRSRILPIALVLAVLGTAGAWVTLRERPVAPVSVTAPVEGTPSDPASLAPSALLSPAGEPAPEAAGRTAATPDADAHPARPAPPPARVLLRTVQGDAIDGVDVHVRRGKLGGPVELTRSDAEGVLDLWRARDGDWLVVHAKGFEPEEVELVGLPWSAPRTVELTRMRPWLSGTLVDDAGAPLAEVDLVMNTGSAESSSVGERFRARTDVHGAFAFHARHAEPPVEASFSVDVRGLRDPAEGEALVWSAWLERGWPRLVAPRLATLELLVETPSGRNVGDAVAVVATEREDGSIRPLGYDDDVFQRGADKGEDGAWCFRLHPPPGEPVWIEVARRADRFWSGGRTAPEHALVELGVLAPGETVRRTVRLERDASPDVVVVARDPTGRPIQGARMRFTYDGRSQGVRGLGPRLSFNRPRGPWSLTVEADGFAPWERAFSGDGADGSIDAVLEPFDATDAGVIEVLVVDQENAPLPGTTVEVRGRVLRATGETDAGGRFVQRGLDPRERYSVHLGDGRPGAYGTERADLAPQPDAHEDVLPGGAPLVFRMHAGASIEGLVPAPIPSGSRAVLAGWTESRDEHRGPAFRSHQALASDGRFAFSGLPAGRYRLEVLRYGEHIAVPLELELATGQRVTDLAPERR